MNIFKYLPLNKLNELNRLEKKIDSNSTFIKSIICKYKLLKIDMITDENDYPEINHLFCVHKGDLVPKFPNLVGLKISTSVDIPFDDHQCLKIKYLDIFQSSWNCTNQIVDSIGKLKNLKSLTLRGFTIDDSVLKELYQLSSLVSLSIKDCKVYPDFFGKISECSNLRVLKLRNLTCKGERFSKHLFDLSKLELTELSIKVIDSCLFSLKHIVNIITLRKLSLQVINFFSNNNLKNLVNLTYLKIPNTYTRTISPEMVSSMKNLRSIVLKIPGGKIKYAMTPEYRDKFKWPSDF